MKKYFVYILTSLFCLAACDNTTGTLGSSIVPEQDAITIIDSTYWATSKSFAVDSVFSKTNKVYLGRFTDPQTGAVLEADFITQFNCEEGGLVFPDDIYDEAVKVELRLFFTKHFGDPTNTMTAEVYELTETLKEDVRYYTDLDPTAFYDAESAPLATKVYTATDYSLEDSELNDSEHYANVNIPLPTDFGTEIIRKYRENKDLFANASSFIEHVCKGFYVKTTAGDGTVLYIDQASLNIHFREKSTNSVFVTQFASTEEVLQANRFITEIPEVLANDNSCTYLKTPAGIFTEVTLPIDEITNDIISNNYSINTAKISFTCKNNETSEYQFGTPQTLLMVHKDEMHTFFEKNHLTDNISSFYTSYNNNSYEYSNIANLITYCNSKRETGTDWNKVVLIPVTTITDSNNSIVNFRHDFSLNSVRLVGGQDKIRIKVIASKFN